MNLNVKCLFVFTAFILLTACAANNKPVGVGSNARNAVAERARAHTNLGAAYFQKKRLEIALDEFNQAAEILPTFAPAFNGLGLVRAALGQYEEAEVNFKKSIDLDPKNAQSRNNYGAFLCSRMRYDESILQFLEAIKNPLYLTPNLAYANAGICAERNKDTTNAITYLNRALQIQPLTHSAAYHLAEIQFRQGNVTTAKTTLRNTLISSPTAQMLWLGVKIERVLGGQDNEASYALQLRRNYPNAKETRLLLSGK